jgi:hypothetical protein
MTTHLTGMLVHGACFGPGGARAFSERAIPEQFFDFSKKLWGTNPVRNA